MAIKPRPFRRLFYHLVYRSIEDFTSLLVLGPRLGVQCSILFIVGGWILQYVQDVDQMLSQIPKTFVLEQLSYHVYEAKLNSVSPQYPVLCIEFKQIGALHHAFTHLKLLEILFEGQFGDGFSRKRLFPRNILSWVPLLNNLESELEDHQLELQEVDIHEICEGLFPFILVDCQYVF